MKSRPWTAEDERKLLELRANGATWREVAWRLGRTEGATVGRAMVIKSRAQAASGSPRGTPATRAEQPDPWGTRPGHPTIKR
jgi:hypothetical protein